MKKLLKFLCGRIFITGLLLLLQAVWLGVFFWKLAAYSVWLNAAFTLLSLLIVLHILYHDDVSGFKIGWIILILQLPVMGGLEATRRIRSVSADVPIIAMSAYSSGSEIESARNAGCNEFLVKPLSQYSLHRALNAALVEFKGKGKS